MSETDQNRMRYGFAGFGLIGGSIAKAIRARVKDAFLIAFDPDQEALSLALRDGVIDASATEVNERFRGLTCLFLCAPVEDNIRNLDQIIPFLSKETILTDIGSVKCAVHDAVREKGLAGQFVGGHPMAGSERVGYANARASLLENAYYVLTKTQETRAEHVETMREFVRTIGALPIELTAEEHDFVTGAISHLPHVVSAALVNLVKENDTPDGVMKQIAAGGFKDITRISSSSPELWRQICSMNRAQLLPLLDRYIASLQEARQQIEANEEAALYALFDAARTYRESFAGTAAGPILREFVFYVDIADRPGMLAGVVQLLSSHGINIKNIGITHNRETEYGSLRIEVYSEEALQEAKSLLGEKEYLIW